MRTPTNAFCHTLVVLLWAAAFASTTGCTALPTHTSGHAASPGNDPLIPEILASSWGWTGFRKPSNDTPARLVQLEPYQPGKIPVVFIHGLLSAPGTWKKMISELRTDPEISTRYQFWVFRYPTGTSFLQSASELRHQLRTTVQRLDSDRQDPAMENMVLVGHSMGGLLAKLQVTDSHERLWKAVSDQPFEKLNADTEARQQIHDALFFEPLPFVKRVVFIGTPHHGSHWTEHPLGRLGRRLVEFPMTLRNDYERLLNANASIFKESPSSGIPTSMDHLAPDNPIIKATGDLPFKEAVSLHSIIGAGRLFPNLTTGDGIVAESSARLDDVDSEMIVPASHRQIHRHRQTIQEIQSILLLHLRYLKLAIPPTKGSM